MVTVFILFLWIYAFYRIEKLKLGIILMLVASGISIGLQLIFPFPYGLILGYITYIVIPVRYLRKYSKEWNSKFSNLKD